MSVDASHTGSRRLLARLRDVMAGGGSAHDKLEQVVTLIAAGLDAQVCSIYVMRAGEVLELFATEGLLRDAVHVTRLRVGEGLVGTIAAHARPLALSDARNHPSFAFRPETGEEIYRSFLGVPILRGGRVMGVLAVQNTGQRAYVDVEIETLETVAMVLAELVAGGELISREETRQIDGIGILPLRLDGLKLAAGIGIGQAVLHRPRIQIERLVSDDPDRELSRLRRAVDEMHGALDNMVESTEGEHRDILETYRMIAEDAGWLSRIEEAVATGLTAEAAVQKVQSDLRARMNQISEPYLRERVHDLDDLANRLQQYLTGGVRATAEMDHDHEFVVIARSMGPAELMDYDRNRMRGLVLEEGSPTAHVTILAKACGVPVIGRARDALDRIETGDPLIVDGDHGQVFVRPSEDVLTAFREAAEARRQHQVQLAALRDLPAVTRNGTRITLSMNAGLLADMSHFRDIGADGIGLYRTEVPFMARPSLPGVDDQANLYGRVLDLANGKPVAFRTLDIGGDKLLPFWDAGDEENPAMGWRAVRMSLDRPALLRQQVRALIRAAAARELRLMFPMVSEVAELDALRRLLDMELERAARLDWPRPDPLRVGVMLEVPALLFQLDDLLPRIDFLSVGSNDLIQFLYAADRGNARLAERYDVLSSAGLRFLRDLARRCDAAGVPVSVCGEMAARPVDAIALVGLGFRHLSVAPSAVAQIKETIRSMRLEQVSPFLDNLVAGTSSSLRNQIKAFAVDHDIAI